MFISIVNNDSRLLTRFYTEHHEAVEAVCSTWSSSFICWFVAVINNVTES